MEDEDDQENEKEDEREDGKQRVERTVVENQATHNIISAWGGDEMKCATHQTWANVNVIFKNCAVKHEKMWRMRCAVQISRKRNPISSRVLVYAIRQNFPWKNRLCCSSYPLDSRIDVNLLLHHWIDKHRISWSSAQQNVSCRIRIHFETNWNFAMKFLQEFGEYQQVCDANTGCVELCFTRTETDCNLLQTSVTHR